MSFSLESLLNIPGVEVFQTEILEKEMGAALFSRRTIVEKMEFSRIREQKAAPSCLDIGAKIKISPHGGGPLQCQLALSPWI